MRDKKGAINIENSVNMASVSFIGSTTYYFYIGGFIGSICSPDYTSTVKNCANYGDVTDSGENTESSIEGIIGDSSYSLAKEVRIYNSLNYGKSRTLAQQAACI